MSHFHSRNGFLILGVLLLALVSTVQVEASRRDFVWTYEWETPIKGEFELELWNTTTPESHKVKQLVEFEYGLTDRWMIAPYFIHEKAKGEKAVDGFKVEQRYRFGKFQKNRFLPAIYFELEKMNEETHKGEFKVLLSRVTRNANFALNLIAERPLRSGAETEYGYAAGISSSINQKLIGGMEIFGEVKTPKCSMGPSIAYEFKSDQHLNLGVAFGMNDQSEDLSVRLIYAIEWLP